jgi:hypothetical protein
MIFCNLAVGKQKLRPSERQEHRIPNLRKAPDVVRHARTTFVILATTWIKQKNVEQRNTNIGKKIINKPVLKQSK